MFCCRRSPITASPLILVEGSVASSFLLLRMYFFRSNLWICLSAKAVAEEIAFSEMSKVEGVLALCVIVMSAPIVEYGQCVCVLSVIVGSGSKDTSKGSAEISLVLMCFFSISNWEDGRIYPACERAGWRALAHESRTMLCDTVLLIFLHLKV